jgi:hypothetical protein
MCGELLISLICPWHSGDFGRKSPVDSLLDQEKCSYATLRSRSFLTAWYVQRVTGDGECLVRLGQIEATRRQFAIAMKLYFYGHVLKQA